MEIEPTGDTLAESIYQEYPKKVAKPSALRAIRKALKKHTAAFLIAKVKEYAEKVKGKDRQYIPHPASWFNDERFKDESESPTGSKSPPPQSLTSNRPDGPKVTLTKRQ